MATAASLIAAMLDALSAVSGQRDKAR